jgi:hypothetical protein
MGETLFLFDGDGVLSLDLACDDRSLPPDSKPASLRGLALVGVFINSSSEELVVSRLGARLGAPPVSRVTSFKGERFDWVWFSEPQLPVA